MSRLIFLFKWEPPQSPEKCSWNEMAILGATLRTLGKSQSNVFHAAGWHVHPLLHCYKSNAISAASEKHRFIQCMVHPIQDIMECNALFLSTGSDSLHHSQMEPKCLSVSKQGVQNLRNFFERCRLQSADLYIHDHCMVQWKSKAPGSAPN